MKGMISSGKEFSPWTTLSIVMSACGITNRNGYLNYTIEAPQQTRGHCFLLVAGPPDRWLWSSSASWWPRGRPGSQHSFVWLWCDFVHIIDWRRYWSRLNIVWSFWYNYFSLIVVPMRNVLFDAPHFGLICDHYVCRKKKTKNTLIFLQTDFILLKKWCKWDLSA